MDSAGGSPGKEVPAHLIVEEFEARFETTSPHLAVCRKRGGLTQCRECGGRRPGRQSSSADGDFME